MSISIQKITYIHADKDILFKDLDLSVNKGQKVALIGNNGSGKSTLLQIIAGWLPPSSGTIIRPDDLYYIPQHFGQYDNQTIAEALQIDTKIRALHAILNGDASVENFHILNDDWNIEERVQTALVSWGIHDKSTSQSMCELSGGEKTRVFLAGMEIHAPSVILLDEPTNHLDTEGRKQLYEFVKRTSSTLIIVSHDRTLLNLLNTTCELTRSGINVYGGNYEFYKEQKGIMMNALQQQLEEKEKELRLAKKTAREMAERKNKQNVRGEKANIKKRIPRIAMNTLKDKAEKSTTDKDINFSYNNNDALWKESLSFQLKSGDRLCIKGANGSGKTTLLKLITGEIVPTQGSLSRIDFKYVYLNQEYSIIKNDKSVLEQAETFNSRNLPEHEIKTILNRYLFPATVWDKSCRKLSGGEKMRLAFCCLMISDNTPDMFILDEPTNNLDIQSIEIITATIKNYTGTVVVVSHDKYFVNEIGIENFHTFV